MKTKQNNIKILESIFVSRYDKDIEQIVKKYNKQITGETVNYYHEQIINKLNIKSIVDSKYFSKTNFGILVNSHKAKGE